MKNYEELLETCFDDGYYSPEELFAILTDCFGMNIHAVYQRLNQSKINDGFHKSFQEEMPTDSFLFRLYQEMSNQKKNECSYDYYRGVFNQIYERILLVLFMKPIQVEMLKEFGIRIQQDKIKGETLKKIVRALANSYQKIGTKYTSSSLEDGDIVSFMNLPIQEDEKKPKEPRMNAHQYLSLRNIATNHGRKN